MGHAYIPDALERSTYFRRLIARSIVNHDDLNVRPGSERTLNGPRQ
jgi:hypothetical protein